MRIIRGPASECKGVAFTQRVRSFWRDPTSPETTLTQTTLTRAFATLFIFAAPAFAQVTSRRPVLQLSGLPMASCPAPRDSVYDATIIPPPSLSRTERTAIVTICLGLPTRLPQIASYDGVLEFPAALAAFDTASLTPGVIGNANETS